MSSRPRREALARILPATGRGRPESAIAQRDALVCRMTPIRKSQIDLAQFHRDSAANRPQIVKAILCRQNATTQATN
jgi:hypothetical protein